MMRILIAMTVMCAACSTTDVPLTGTTGQELTTVCDPFEDLSCGICDATCAGPGGGSIDVALDVMDFASSDPLSEEVNMSARCTNTGPTVNCTIYNNISNLYWFCSVRSGQEICETNSPTGG